MHKRKPHKGLQKRTRVSAKGKVRYKKSFSGHLMSHKTGDRCRRLRKMVGMVGKINDNALEALCKN
ncbi:MAG: 50S ribosomal protein L35 [Phycisphaerae bacterium]